MEEVNSNLVVDSVKNMLTNTPSTKESHHVVFVLNKDNAPGHMDLEL